MIKIYACLTGRWVCLNDDPNCKIGEKQLSPAQWFEEDAVVYYPSNITKADSYYSMPYLNLNYEGVDYRINPIFIQILK